jgi:hypothetical protein
MKTKRLLLLLPGVLLVAGCWVHPAPAPVPTATPVASPTVSHTPTASPSPSQTLTAPPGPIPAPSWTWPPTSACGVERWPVKTGTDGDASQINLGSVTDTTIANLGTLSAPASLPQSNRVSPNETTVYRIKGTLTLYKLESDSDYHLVIADSSGNTMIVEIPDPACVAGKSGPLLTGIETARSEFDAKYHPSGSFQTANVPVTVVGVGFYDPEHGQTGGLVLAGGKVTAELHPVLSIQFGS